MVIAKISNKLVVRLVSPHHLKNAKSCFFLVTFYLPHVSRLQIAHMTRSELYLPDTTFIGPGLLFLNQYFNSFVDEHIVLWIAMVSIKLRDNRYLVLNQFYIF